MQVSEKFLLLAMTKQREYSQEFLQQKMTASQDIDYFFGWMSYLDATKSPSRTCREQRGNLEYDIIFVLSCDT
jgi:hypothetical protein